MYCVDEFSRVDIDEWQYVIWKIKRISDTGRWSLPRYVCVKKIYDPMNKSKVGDMLTKPSIFKSERKVILRIFEGI